MKKLLFLYKGKKKITNSLKGPEKDLQVLHRMLFPVPINTKVMDVTAALKDLSNYWHRRTTSSPPLACQEPRAY